MLQCISYVCSMGGLARFLVHRRRRRCGVLCVCVRSSRLALFESVCVSLQPHYVYDNAYGLPRKNEKSARGVKVSHEHVAVVSCAPT